jgi:two-component system, chemotaxis family, sensor kinase CheA
VGLIVDEVVGLQQTVIKNLGEAYKDIQGLSGATIQGDGSLALILDVEPLVARATEQVESRA